MKCRRSNRALSGIVAAAWIAATAAALPGTSFTYQGQLKRAGATVDGTADFRFSLWNAPTGGSQVGPTLVFDGVGGNPQPILVNDGIFSVQLDFGGAPFTGDALWLQIEVRNPSGAGALVAVAPRQPLTAVPYSLATRGLVVDGNQAVGVGLASGTPTARLHISDAADVPASPSTSSYAPLKITGGGAQALLADANQLESLGSPLYLNARNAAPAQNIVLGLGGGAVGVGTASPTHRLTVQGATEDVLRLIGPAGFGVGARLNFGDGNDVYLRESPNDLLELRATSGFSFTGGPVGIGVAQPQSPLHIAAAGAGPHIRVAAGPQSLDTATLALDATAAGGSPFHLSATGTASPDGAGKLVIRNAAQGQTLAALTNAGKLGIGITNPDWRVQVVDTTPDGTGLQAEARSGVGAWGVAGYSTLGVGVYGEASGTGNENYGVYGYTAAPTQGWGVYCEGDLGVTRDLYAGGSKNFRIDHPLDPAGRYLVHAAIESDQRRNVYCGRVTTDGQGVGVVTLPGYVAASNIGFEYQLTAIGEFAQAIVSEEVKGDRFVIRTDRPRVTVSWQLTGVRNDAYAQAHPFVAEPEKRAEDRGRYVHPELFDAAADARLPRRPAKAGGTSNGEQ